MQTGVCKAPTPIVDAFGFEKEMELRKNRGSSGFLVTLVI